MNAQRMALAAVLTGFAGAATFAQTAQDKTQEKKSAAAVDQERKAGSQAEMAAKDSDRAEAYYNFTMGHIYEQQ
ncbi:MAG: hypothetical protein ACRD36_04535, partial [Candidatus Acidiferrum sp.]